MCRPWQLHASLAAGCLPQAEVSAKWQMPCSVPTASVECSRCGCGCAVCVVGQGVSWGKCKIIKWPRSRSRCFDSHFVPFCFVWYAINLMLFLLSFSLRALWKCLFNLRLNLSLFLTFPISLSVFLYCNYQKRTASTTIQLNTIFAQFKYSKVRQQQLKIRAEDKSFTFSFSIYQAQHLRIRSKTLSAISETQ